MGKKNKRKEKRDEEFEEFYGREQDEIEQEVAINRSVSDVMEPKKKVHRRKEHIDDALVIAAEEGDAERAKSLLGDGANPNHQSSLKHRSHQTALCAALENDDVPFARLLCEGGALATVQGEKGWLPLHVAASQGNLEAVRLLLLEPKAQETSRTNTVDTVNTTVVEARTDQHETPLMIAASYHQASACRVLLNDYNADITASDHLGNDSIRWAKRSRTGGGQARLRETVAVLETALQGHNEIVSQKRHQRNMIIGFAALVACVAVFVGVYLLE